MTIYKTSKKKTNTQESVDLMIDIETLGTGNNSVIIAIGAVYFDTANNRIGKKFYTNIDPQSCIDAGLEMDASTVMWWMSKDKAAQDAVFTDQQDVGDALSDFTNFIGRRRVTIWGNGSTFDNVILANAYKKLKMTLPWNFWDNRDVRTIMAIDRHRAKKETGRVGTHHNALDDAETQANWVINAMQRLQ